jgi:hypothetical protein
MILYFWNTIKLAIILFDDEVVSFISKSGFYHIDH